MNYVSGAFAVEPTPTFVVWFKWECVVGQRIWVSHPAIAQEGLFCEGRGGSPEEDIRVAGEVGVSQVQLNPD